MTDDSVTFEDVWGETSLPNNVVDLFQTYGLQNDPLSNYFSLKDGSVLTRAKPLFDKMEARLSDPSDQGGFARFIVICGGSVGKPKKRKYDDYRRYQQSQGMLTPSGFGKREEWPKQQADSRKLIMCGRPAGTANFLNVCIMHPVFQQVVDAATTGEPAPEDFELAARLVNVQPNTYEKEGYRREQVSDLLNEYIASKEKTTIGVRMVAQGSESDGMSAGGFFNVEYKIEKGEGKADPYMENAAYFALFWGARDGPKKHCCPWLLMEVVGQEIGLSGGVFACDFPCVHPLTSNVPFLEFPQNRRMQMVQARLCLALRIGFRGLSSFYRDQVPRMEPNSQAGFPYKKTFMDATGKDVHLTYVSLLNPALRRPIFRAVREDTKEIVVVKFTPFYGDEVHSLLAGKGFAPVLHNCTKMDDLFMVVMELCEGVLWTDPSSAQKEALIMALQCLEESGHVHGDLRPPNILLVGSNEIRILDFDWAGKAGQAQYPIALNQQVSWHQEAGAGKLMETAHDQHMVSLLCGSSN